MKAFWHSRFGRAVMAISLLFAVVGFRPISVHEVGPLSDVAIEGYDPVAYFTEGRPIHGRAILQVNWQGARWYFSSPEHKRLFEADPLRYAPAYGGYCAMCVGESGTVQTPGDPEVFLIHEGRLFLLQSEIVRRQWLKDIDRLTSEATKSYEALVALAPVEVGDHKVP